MSRGTGPIARKEKGFGFPEHEMHVNEKVHKKHEHRLEEEIERLEKLEHEHRKRLRA
ncbi:MAG: hypothetical protein UNLARM2_0028 [Candidatus Micrarchaeum acidiphilum ARMAN-2]|uniref:Uncharacterized protein n=1 Tax=Candidatus Micrarchaeum acidiphilum ARMAN-2 TaxID=425595 RepID=C7DG19_MICA2|nr:MAG: hypothetical protein UNLARM2_0028 [Candidatus Micrarchaeum acidiphilum ARMAN-2]